MAIHNTRLLSIDFEWSVDEDGYEWVPGEPVDGPVDPEAETSAIDLLFISLAHERRPDRIRRRGGKLRTYRPFEGPDRLLYRIFASQARDRDGLVDFVNQYGPMTAEGNRDGEPALLGLTGASTMAELLQWYSENRRDWFSGYAINQLAWSRIDVALVRNPMTGRPQFRFTPPSLFNALWFEVGEFLTRDAQVRECLHCGAWFEAGPGTGRRDDAKFCSDPHRIAFNSRKRTKGKDSHA